MQNRTNIDNLINSNLPDNASRFISAELLREVVEALNDSNLNLIDDKGLLGLSSWKDNRVYNLDTGVIHNNVIYKSKVANTTLGTFIAGEWLQISNAYNGTNSYEDFILKTNGIELDDNKRIKIIPTDTTLSGHVTGYYLANAITAVTGLDKMYPVSGKAVVQILNGASTADSLISYYPLADLSKFYIKKVSSNIWTEFNNLKNLQTKGVNSQTRIIGKDDLTGELYQIKLSSLPSGTGGVISVDYTFSNGLNENANNVKLGGNLINDTYIDVNNKVFQLTVPSFQTLAVSGAGVYSSGGYWMREDKSLNWTYSGLQTTAGSYSAIAKVTANGSGMQFYHGSNSRINIQSGSASKLTLAGGGVYLNYDNLNKLSLANGNTRLDSAYGITFSDGLLVGAKYESDYSTSWNSSTYYDNVLVSKKYVDNLINSSSSGSGSSYTFANGLTSSAGIVKLGGIQTENISIIPDVGNTYEISLGGDVTNRLASFRTQIGNADEAYANFSVYPYGVFMDASDSTSGVGFTITTSGITMDYLAGSGTRMAVVNEDGKFSTQPIPVTANYIPLTGSSNITGNLINNTSDSIFGLADTTSGVSYIFFESAEDGKTITYNTSHAGYSATQISSISNQTAGTFQLAVQGGTNKTFGFSSADFNYFLFSGDIASYDLTNRNSAISSNPKALVTNEWVTANFSSSGLVGVTSVSGTTNRITATGTTTPVIDISSAYVGQASITTLGTISTGTWNATTIGVSKGGTGLTSIGSANQLLRVNSGATALEYFTPTYFTLPSFTAGSILFSNGSTIAQDNTNLFFNDTTNHLGLGTSSPQSKLHVSDGNALAASFISSFTSGDIINTSNGLATYRGISANAVATGRSVIHLLRSRGTLTTPTAVVADDNLGDLLFGGHDGTTIINAAGLFAFADGTVTTGNVPMRLSFVTGTNAGNRTERLLINSTGNIGIGTGTTISAKTHIIATTEQLRLGYDVSNYFSTTVSSVGQVTFNAVGSNASFIFSDELLINGSLASNSTATNANFYVTSSTGTNNTNTSSVLIGGASSINTRIIERGSGNSTIGTGNSYASHIIGTQSVTTFTSGIHNIFSQLAVKPLSITPNGATVNNAATVYIENASSAGLTNNYALWVDAGKVRLDDLAGSGTRMVTASSSGLLSTTTLPVTTSFKIASKTINANSVASTNLDWVGSYSASNTLPIFYILKYISGTFTPDLIDGSLKYNGVSIGGFLTQLTGFVTGEIVSNNVNSFRVGSSGNYAVDITTAIGQAASFEIEVWGMSR